jgi:hypothetical protein
VAQWSLPWVFSEQLAPMIQIAATTHKALRRREAV